MRIPSKAAGLGIAILATLALAGCVQPPPPVIPTSAPSITPVFKTEAAALAAAKTAYTAYLAVSDEILADGGQGPERLLAVATPSELKAQQSGFKEFRDKQWHSTGDTTIDEITLQNYSPTSLTDVVSVYVCLDVSKVDVLNSDDDSVVSTSRPSQQPFQASFDLVTHSSSRLLLSSEQPWSNGGVCS